MTDKKIKSKSKTISQEEIIKELEGYEIVKNPLKLNKFDTIKYFRKDDGSFKKGGIIIDGNKDKRYIVVKAFYTTKTGKPITFSLGLDDVIIFRKID